MALTTKVRTGLNRLLAGLNIQIGSLTAAREEEARLRAISAAGLFDRPVYALSPGMESFDAGPLIEAFKAFGKDIEPLRQAATNTVGYRPDNGYFTTPDMDVLYLMIRMLKPARVVEVGCGSSTRITRQAIRDGGLATELVAIDPWPRNDISALVDRFEKRRLEQVEDYSVFEDLGPGDVLFIDSSHEARLGNDVARLFCDVIPRLKAGVVIHVHDIFLPYEYPEIHSRMYAGWGEQYMVHCLLQAGRHEILWPGCYLQKARPSLAAALPFLDQGRAQSFWFRIG